MKSDICAPPYNQNGMIITPREYSTVRLGFESGSSYQSIESSTIRGHPYFVVSFCMQKTPQKPKLTSFLMLKFTMLKLSSVMCNTNTSVKIIDRGPVSERRLSENSEYVNPEMRETLGFPFQNGRFVKPGKAG